MDIGNIFEEWDFSGSVPLPYRVLLMGCIGVFAWATNLHLLAYLRVDVPALLFSHPPLPAHHIRLHRPPPLRQQGGRDSDNPNNVGGGGGGTTGSGGGGGGNNNTTTTISNSNSSISNSNSSSTSKYSISPPASLMLLYRATYMLGIAFLIMTLLNMSVYKWAISHPGALTTTTGTTTAAAAAAAAAATDKSTTGSPATPMRGGIGRDGNPRAGILVPVFGYMTIITMLFIPFNILFIKERFRFLRSMKKVCLSGFNTGVTFSDVILADILTSFARVFGDLAVALCLMFWGGRGSGSTESCYNSPLVPIMTSVPYFIRLRQCLTEYKDSHYKIKRHLMNALKYASAFPVILISHLQKSAKAAALEGASNQSMFSDNALFRLWLLFVALNSFYSFYWDIKHDWMLIERVPGGATSGAGYNNIYSGLPSSPAYKEMSSGSSNMATLTGRSPPTLFLRSPRTWWPWFHQWSGLSKFRMRYYLHYEEAYFYMFAIVLDFLLRTTWMMKVFGNIQIEEYEGGVFTMECLEVLRRWVWVLFRLEAEMVKRQAPSSPSTESATFFVGGISGGEENIYHDYSRHHHHQHQHQHHYRLGNDTFPMTMTNLSATTLVSTGGGGALSTSSSTSAASAGDLGGMDAKMEKGER
ncbi:protein-ER retention protein [Actinomortierella ambigua]|uniref:Protein-ER retention protein n=1 Tax=Actinomortierella ambigua TaxID=1343610 RepID=A0A9P6U189_9FUNG|nr:protein-ER retention protein [Actinomortierella ambigua]